MKPRLPLLLVTTALAAAASIPAAHGSTPGTVDPTVPAARDTDPVVLTGKDLLAGSSVWAVPENLTVAVPEKDAQCMASATSGCPGEYNHYVEPDVDTSGPQ